MAKWEVANCKISVLFIYKLVPYIIEIYSSMKLTTCNTFCLYLIEKSDGEGGLMEQSLSQSDWYLTDAEHPPLPYS